ncbi:MAG: glycoside hydrolase [Gemmatimonadota bacterium]|nr:glycoside hydrolase [Gemmatimonadota bacterium]
MPLHLYALTSRSARSLALVVTLSVCLTAPAFAQTPDIAGAMHWRSIGPTRAGRARALAGVPSQPNVFYAGYDNGGVWRSTDYGSTWVPLFDEQPTGSIGAIAVAPSDPNIIYVGTGAGIIRPDLAVGNGVYKSTDAGKTWVHLGLRDSQMIAMIDVDPRNPNRLFVAALGHPYGPNEERGIFRSTDGGKTFEKVLYKDAYTSANDVRIDPNDPNTVYAALWQQQQSFIEGAQFDGASGGIFKSTDGGSSWKPLSVGLPGVLQANLAIAPSNTKVLYAMVAGAPTAQDSARGADEVLALYKSVDAGEHWYLAVHDPNSKDGGANAKPDGRPLQRIGGGDLATLAVDPKDENGVYSASIVFWRSENGGVTWSAVRGSPGGDDYQKLWINPTNPNIILLVSDQGAVVSSNRGASWSNWYTQSTAAMYHVSTDASFVYRVCGGQQDSGSACVDSRSMDGEITFHDWHPVDIQEYGIAAPDPKDPDKVYGSMRSNVSLFNRKTGQITHVGPDATERGAKYNRNVRTMPIIWSPLDPSVLFYTSNAVWKSVDHAHSWTRISPDLTRQSWAVPANAGKYASTITPSPKGAITALSPSPRKIGVIWAGADDGTIQVTANGGATWSNVTPAEIKPWTRIFNIEAGHFDDRTAYAAANTLRLDDMNPHFWRTHDGGKRWTEIDAGIAPGAVANSIREDPRRKGLLYAATDAQVWVSFDDGDHWQSLKRDMPAISVRDLEVKDDSTCMCSDLIAATHGRGFWILDDITPLRQMASVSAARDLYLLKPATAVRVRGATNDPTPWPPELPAGENPSAGAIIDYYLAAAAHDTIAIEIVDATGKVIRRYSSADRVLDPDPARNPEAYNLVCQKDPKAPDCGLPLYWPAPTVALSTAPGMHRMTWDLRYDPIMDERENVEEDESGNGAVPHRTFPAMDAPWVPPGKYTVRLVGMGTRLEQPLTLRLDPRVKTPAVGLAQLALLSKEMYDDAVIVRAASARAGALRTRLEGAGGSATGDIAEKLDAIAPAKSADAEEAPRRRGGAEPSRHATLGSVGDELMAAAMSMQGADIAPSANQIAACRRARDDFRAVLTRWNAIEAQARRAANGS